MLAVDLAAIALLTFGVYYPRHRRRDLLVAFIGVNIGVFAVAAVLAVAAIAMRRILIERARAQGRQKRGGDLAWVPLEEADNLLVADGAQLLAVNDANCSPARGA